MINRQTFPCSHKNDLCEILNLIKNNSCVFVAGFPGMGKSFLHTELCSHFSKSSEFSSILEHRIAPHTSSADFFSRMSDLVNNASGKMIIPSGSSSPAILCEAVSRHRLLLLLDDFHNLDQIISESLLDALSSCAPGKVVLFSRHLPDSFQNFRSIAFHRLKNLTAEETADMIFSILQFHGNPVSEGINTSLLARITGGHPLLIKLFAGLLLSRKITLESLEQSPELLIQKIDEFLKSMFWSSLPEISREILLILAQTEIPIDSILLNDVFQTDTSAEQQKLLRQCLIETDGSSFWVNSMLRQFVINNSSSDNILSYQIKTAASLYHCFPCSINHLREALRISISCSQHLLSEKIITSLVDSNQFLEDVLSDLVPLLQKAVSIFNPVKPEIYACLARQLILSGRDAEAEALLNSVSPGQFYFLKGLILIGRGEHDASMEYLKKSQELSQNPQELLRIRLYQALAFSQCGRIGDASEILDQISDNSEIHQNDILMLFYLKCRTNLCYFTTNLDEGIDYTFKTEKLCQKLNTETRLSEALYMRGAMYRSQGNFSEAEASIRKSLDITVSSTNTPGQMSCLSVLGDLSGDMDNFQQAIELKTQAIRLSDSLGTLNFSAADRAELGYFQAMNFDFDNSRKSFSDAFEVLDKISDLYTSALIRVRYAVYLILSGQLQQASDEMERLLSDLDSLPPVIRCHTRFYHWKAQQLSGSLNSDALFSAYQDSLSVLNERSAENHRRSSTRFEKRIELKKQGYFVLTANRRFFITDVEKLEEYRKNCHKYGFFADLENKTVAIDGKPSRVTHQKIMFSLLKVFVLNPGQEFSANSIFSLVWKKKFNHAGDANVFRMNISRLRKVLDPGNQDRFISKSDDIGRYSFSPAESYLILFRG